MYVSIFWSCDDLQREFVGKLFTKLMFTVNSVEGGRGAESIPGRQSVVGKIGQNQNI